MRAVVREDQLQSQEGETEDAGNEAQQSRDSSYCIGIAGHVDPGIDDNCRFMCNLNRHKKRFSILSNTLGFLLGSFVRRSSIGHSIIEGLGFYLVSQQEGMAITILQYSTLRQAGRRFWRPFAPSPCRTRIPYSRFHRSDPPPPQ